jgi:hypothetical protein
MSQNRDKEIDLRDGEDFEGRGRSQDGEALENRRRMVLFPDRIYPQIFFINERNDFGLIAKDAAESASERVQEIRTRARVTDRRDEDGMFFRTNQYSLVKSPIRPSIPQGERMG